MGLIQRDHVVEQVAATAFDPTLGNSVLPGLSKEVRTGIKPIDRTAIGVSNPYLLSRSKIRNL